MLERGGKADFQSCCIIIYKMLSFQQKLEGIKKDNKVWSIHKKKKKSIKTVETWTLDLVDKNTESTILNMFKDI